MIIWTLRILGVLTVLLLGIGVFTLAYWEERRQERVKSGTWTKNTQRPYTMGNPKTRPLPDAGIQPRKLHGGGAP